MRFHEGDKVTVRALPHDPYILNFQRYAVVSRVTDRGVYVVLDATCPPGEEFGPFPPRRLLLGWRDENGEWRDAP
jgi:hypothetical protein